MSSDTKMNRANQICVVPVLESTKSIHFQIRGKPRDVPNAQFRTISQIELPLIDELMYDLMNIDPDFINQPEIPPLYQIVKYRDQSEDSTFREVNEIEFGFILSLEQGTRVNFLQKLIEVHRNEIRMYEKNNSLRSAFIDDILQPFSNTQTPLKIIGSEKRSSDKHNSSGNCYTGMQCSVY